jgi:hypothetical protein
MRLAAATAMIAAIVLAAGCGDDEGATTTTTAAEPSSEEKTTAVSSEPPDDRLEVDPAKRTDAAGTTASDPEEVLEVFFTSGIPDLVCGELATDNLLSSAYGDEEGCRKAQVPAATPDSIEITDLEESGDEATATVIPDGGPNDGIETEVVLVKEGDAWLVDSLEADVPAGP